MEESSQEPTRLQKVKQHLKVNKKVYIVGASTAVVSSAVTVLAVRGRFCPDIVQNFANSSDNIALAVNRSKNVDVVIKYLNQRNYNAKPVRCLETLQEWASQEEAAEGLGIASSIISQHLNGKFAHAKGFHLEWIK